MRYRRSRGTSRSDRKWPDRYTILGEVQYHVESLGILRDHRRERVVHGLRRSSRIRAWQPKPHGERRKSAKDSGNEMKGKENGKGENVKSERSKENGKGKKSYAKSNRNENASVNGNGRGSVNERRRNDGKWKGEIERLSGRGCWYSNNGNRRQLRQQLVRTPWYEIGLRLETERNWTSGSRRNLK